MRKKLLIAAAGAAASYLRSEKGRTMVKQLGRKVRPAPAASARP
jgi:hypothetical protein